MLPLVQAISIPPAAAAVPAGLGVSSLPFDANIVPTARQTPHGLAAQRPTDRLASDHLRQQTPVVIAHPRQAPSSVSSEQFLAARASSSPAYQHNILATKMARISNLHAETPRFRNQIDILA